MFFICRRKGKNADHCLSKFPYVRFLNEKDLFIWLITQEDKHTTLLLGQTSVKLLLSLKVSKLQRCTRPHFKALDPLF